MSNAIGTLRELHRLRRHIKSLRDEINRVPLQIKAIHAKIARHDGDVAAAQDKLNHLKVTIRQNEGSLKQRHQQIAKWEGQRQGVQSKKEYDALEHEIAAEKAKCGELEDAILEDMTKSEETAARIPELEKALKMVKEDLGRFEQTSKERVAALQDELARTEAQLKEVEAALPPDIRPHYERVVSQRGEDALALAQNRTCSACHTALTEQQHNDLLSGRLVVCKTCGRIVYLAQEAL